MTEEMSSAIPTKILVPIDFSPSSHAALESAAALAAKFGAEVLMLHVIPQFPSGSLPDSINEAAIVENARAEAERMLGLSQAGLAAKGISAAALVENGTDIAGNIIDAIEREKADMLVISTHGISGWYPLVFGSIAEKVVKLAHCPVLLLRTPKPESSAMVPFGRSMVWW